MNALLNRITTPLVTGFFFVSTISGIALFFHWAPGAFHSMHEWLSMVLILPFALHLWKNWGAFMTYVKRKTLWIPLALSILVAIPFAIGNTQAVSGRGGNPAFRAVRLMTQAPISQVAPLLHTSPEALVAHLNDQGFKASSTEDSLGAIAETAGIEPLEMLMKVMPQR